MALLLGSGRVRMAALAFMLLASSFLARAGETALAPEYQDLARDIFRELIEIRTTLDAGTTRAAEAARARLKKAGFADAQVLGHKPEYGNMIARFRGTGKAKPILFIVHLDVVAARAEDWTFDPFTFTERDGYFYGRGTIDIKNEAANMVANFIRLKREGFKPGRDLILALTANEETSDQDNGLKWLLEHHPELLQAEFCINPDAGGGEIKGGKYGANPIQTAEKVFLSFQLEAKSKGGHSSVPTKDNPIYHLSRAIDRIANFDFPIHVNDTVRGYFARMAETETGLLAEDMRAVAGEKPNIAAAARLGAALPAYNALLRTTAVATQISGGHAENALPQSAKSTINCRILPEESPDEVEATLRRVIGNEQIEIKRIDEAIASPSSPVNPFVFGAAERIVSDLWPGARVFPTMSNGASDSIFLRRAGVPVYGVSGMFSDVEDSRAHGQNERIGVADFYNGVEFTYRFIKAIAAPQP